MEETRKEKMWASLRAQFAEMYRRASFMFDVQGFLRRYFLGHVSDHERRKHEATGFSGSEKQVKLKQVATCLRLGGWILIFALLCTLAVAFMFEGMLHQQMEREFDAIATTNVGKERGKDETFNRKIKLVEEKNLIYEEDNKVVRMRDDKRKDSIGIIDKEEDFTSGKENTAVEISEGKSEKRQPEYTLSATLGGWRKSEKLKTGLPGGNDRALNRDSKFGEDIKAATHVEAGMTHDAKYKEGSLTSEDNRLRAARESFEKDVERQQASPLLAADPRVRRESTKLRTGLLRGNIVSVNEESKFVKGNKATGVSYAGDEPPKITEYKEGSSTPDTVAVMSHEIKDQTQRESTTSVATEQRNGSGKLKSELQEDNDTTFSSGTRSVEENKAAVVAREGGTSSGIAHEAGYKEGRLTSTATDPSAGTNNTGQLQQELSMLALEEPEDESRGLNLGFLERIDEASDLKQDSETNRSTQQSSNESVQSQQESLMVLSTEPEDESTELNIESLEDIDEAFERILRKTNVPHEKEAKVVGVVSSDEKNLAGLISEGEHKENISLSEEQSRSLGITHNNTQNELLPALILTSVIENLQPDILKGNDLHSNLLDTEEMKVTSKEGIGEGGMTHADEEKPARTADNEDIKECHSTAEQVTDAGRVYNGNNQSMLTPALQHTDESGNLKVSSVEKYQQAGDHNEALVNPEEGGDVFNENKNKALGSSREEEVKAAGVTHEEMFEDSIVEDQEIQAQIRRENSDDWPQESALITPLRQETESGMLRIGLLNMEATDFQRWQYLVGERPIIFPFERVNGTLEWKDLYPEWIDEEERYGTPNCPSVPMPKVPSGVQLDVVVVHAPCSTSSPLQDGWRDPAYLQVLLGAASLAVKTGNKSIYVLVFSGCRPFLNLFTSEDLLEHRDQGWLYKVDVEQMRDRLSLPVGSCQVSVPSQGQEKSLSVSTSKLQKEAYATILHSGPNYVCGAIVAARSIRQAGSTKDLVILVDESTLPEHRQGLEEAGWKLQEFERIRNANAVDGKYNERDFSKFRLWQLTGYSKVIYLDADLLVLRNLDILFKLPELSASGSTKTMFNSGVMVIKPSNHTFSLLMDEMQEMSSENGGDQDLLNRVFPWWHRIPRHMNYLKYFWTRQTNEVEYMNRLFSAEPPKLYAIHYWGYKPWECFKDYDCNWNYKQQYASDEAHAQWFKVHDAMPENLQKHCSLSTVRKVFLEYNRWAAEAAGFTDKHWSINILTQG